MKELLSCPLCNGQNLTKYRFNIGGFLDKDGCIETICENGDTFRIECDCGCKFDKCQDELFDKAEKIYTCDGKYGVEITDADLWNIMVADWNRRYLNGMIVSQHTITPRMKNDQIQKETD